MIIFSIIGFFAFGLGQNEYKKYVDPEGYAERQTEYENERQIEEQKKYVKEQEERVKKSEQIRKEREAKLDASFKDAKTKIHEMLQSARSGISSCEKLSTSEKLPSWIKAVHEDTIVNSVLIILLIEQAEKEYNYYGLSNEKRQIPVLVDRLTDCVNKH